MTHLEHKKAQKAKLGIWNIKDYAIDKGFNKKVAKSKLEKKPKTTKANSKETTKKSKKSGSSVYYKNCPEAREAGAVPLRRDDPGYRSKLDRDGDDVDCK